MLWQFYSEAGKLVRVDKMDGALYSTSLEKKKKTGPEGISSSYKWPSQSPTPNLIEKL